jgi:hypothetical protein
VHNRFIKFNGNPTDDSPITPWIIRPNPILRIPGLRTRKCSLQFLYSLHPKKRIVTLFATFFDNQSWIVMRQYSLLLAEALLAFTKQVMALQHEYRNSWYDAVNRLDNRARRICPPELQIEQWDISFLIKHSVLDDHVPGSRIPSIEIGQRSIEERFW